MPNNWQEHIAKIRSEFQASQRIKDSLNHSIQKLAQDLYSTDTHFIFELIQNAEDNTYDRVTPSLIFQLVKRDPLETSGANGALIIKNNEVGFSVANVSAICAVGETTKTNKEQGYIGEKGIGFKSVFRVTSKPYIFSNGYKFCMPERDEDTGLGFIVPQWVEHVSAEIDPQLTTIILPLDKPDYGYVKIEEMLRDIEPETILFLSKLKQFHIKTDTGDDLVIEKDDSEAPHVQMHVRGTRQGKKYTRRDEYLVYSRSFEKPQGVSQEKREGINRRDVTVAFLDYKVSETGGKIFAYLPVRSDTNLPFLINADFILTSSREEIKKGLPWNQWLMECVAQLSVDSLIQLREQGKLTSRFLETLATRLLEIPSDSIYIPIARAINHALQNEVLLPADDESYVSARNAKLARGNDLRELLNQEQLRLLFGTKDEIKWLAAEITPDNTPNLRRYLMNNLEAKVDELTPDSFARRLAEPFLVKQTDQWLIKFYKFLLDKGTLWHVPKNPYETRGVLLDKLFLRLEDGSHVQPFNDNGKPNVFLSSDDPSAFRIIRKSITEDEIALDFLKKLGLSKPGEEAEIENTLKTRYGRKSEGNFAPDLNDILRFVRFFEKNPDKADMFSNSLIFKRTDSHWGMPRDVFLDSPFYPTGLNAYYSVLQEASVPRCLSAEYMSLGIDIEVLVKFAKATGVIDQLPIQETNCSANPEYPYLISARGSYSAYSTNRDYTIEHLDNVLKTPSTELSRLVWQRMNSLDSRFLVATFQKSSSGERRQTSSRLVHILENTAWIPQKNGSIVKPCDATVEQLPDGFSFDKGLEWIKSVEFGKTAIKLSEDYHSANQSALRIGFESIEQATEWAKLAQVAKQHGKTPADFLSRFEPPAPKTKPAFPIRKVSDSARRQERIGEQISDAPDKKYEQVERSVRTSDEESRSQARIRLKEYYTNSAGQMLCQICKDEMPFKKRDGEYYFEVVEAFSNNHINKEHESQFLALCPLCSAMYNVFVKSDNNAEQELVIGILNSPEPEVTLSLGELNTSIRFVESHWLDLKTILQQMGAK